MSAILENLPPYDPGKPADRLLEPPSGVEGDNPLKWAMYGIQLREGERYAEAEAVFERLMTSFPGQVYGWQELGVLRRRQGRDQDALELFQHASNIQPDDFNTRQHLCYQLARLGQAEAARNALAAHPAHAKPGDGRFRAFEELLEYVSEFPESKVISRLQEFRNSARFMPHAGVAERINRALLENRPLSLIRLGDGEGAWMTVSADDEARFATMYEANRREILKVWFGTDRLYGVRGFMDLPRRFKRVLDRTDLIGLPYASRVQHEYALASTRGISSIANIFRVLAPALESKAPWQPEFCENDVHLDLHLHGALRDLLTSPHKIGIISCHPDLGFRLTTAYGARVVRQIIVPEERSFSQVAGVSGILAEHYPLMFYRTLAQLDSVARDARIWLIAAGFLGKFYCDAVRMKGGIALDIGSVADGWSGRVTRPTLRQIDRFALETPAP